MLVRSWMRALAGASGAVVLLPAALLVALALTVSVGGGVGSLAQLVAGPEVPPTAEARAAGRDGAPAASRAEVPAIPAAAPATRAVPRRVAVRRPTRRGGGTTPKDDPPSRSAPSGPSPSPSPARPAPQRPPATPPTTPTPAPPPPAPANPVREVGEVVEGTVRPVPVVGEPVGDVVETVIDLVAPPPG